MFALLSFIYELFARSSVKELTYCEKLYKEIYDYKTELDETIQKHISLDRKIYKLFNYDFVNPYDIKDKLVKLNEHELIRFNELQGELSKTSQELTEIRDSMNLKIRNRLIEEIEKINFPDDPTKNLSVYGLFYILSENNNYKTLIKEYPQYCIVIEHDDYNNDSRYNAESDKLKSFEFDEQFKIFAIQGLNYKFYSSWIIKE